MRYLLAMACTLLLVYPAAARSYQENISSLNREALKPIQQKISEGKRQCLKYVRGISSLHFFDSSSFKGQFNSSASGIFSGIFTLQRRNNKPDQFEFICMIDQGKLRRFIVK